MHKINIFKPGKHTSANGTTLEFSEADLQATVDAYNPKTHEAPIVVGHPKDNGPAYGWVKALSFTEDTGLEADPQQVDEQFQEMVNAGRFKKVSASFYTPESPNNPHPGVYYLRHVGFLGAQPPAVKGLRDASFNEAEEGVVEFGDWADIQNASLWRKLREWIIGKDGLEEADKVIPAFAVEDLEANARKPDPEPLDTPKPITNSFTEENTVTEAELKAENDRLKAELQAEQDKNASFAERETTLAAKEALLAKQDSDNFIDGLAKAGKITPAQQAGLSEFMQSLNQEMVVEFGEGDNKASKKQAEFFRNFLESLPVQVDFSEQSGGKSGEPAELSQDEIIEQAQDYIEEQRKKGREVSATEAVDFITQQQAGS